MNARYLPLITLILFISLVRAPRVFRPDVDSEAALLSPILCPQNHESMLACGRRIPLSRLALYDFEFFPRISDTLAMRLERARTKIAAQARDLPPERQAEALMVVKGIGPKTADALGRYIDLRE